MILTFSEIHIPVFDVSYPWEEFLLSCGRGGKEGVRKEGRGSGGGREVLDGRGWGFS